MPNSDAPKLRIIQPIYLAVSDRRRKPCDALNSRRAQRLRRALRVAGLRARLAVFVVPTEDFFVFAIFLLASFRPDTVVRVRLAVERFFDRAALPIDPFAPPFRRVVFLATAPLPAPFLAATLLATPFLPKLLLAPASLPVASRRPFCSWSNAGVLI